MSNDFWTECNWNIDDFDEQRFGSSVIDERTRKLNYFKPILSKLRGMGHPVSNAWADDSSMMPYEHPPGYLQGKDGNLYRCDDVVNNRTNWNESRSICASEMSGSHLAIVDNENSLNALKVIFTAGVGVLV